MGVSLCLIPTSLEYINLAPINSLCGIPTIKQLNFHLAWATFFCELKYKPTRKDLQLYSLFARFNDMGSCMQGDPEHSGVKRRMSLILRDGRATNTKQMRGINCNLYELLIKRIIAPKKFKHTKSYTLLIVLSQYNNLFEVLVLDFNFPVIYKLHYTLQVFKLDSIEKDNRMRYTAVSFKHTLK
ncbi:hypothetical protein NQ317_012482 [Molorchus minor]|uniref:Uncharacterized protein n=1 Tax=Molorchus minor TaxID=1323400 RepID=A0ABQ9K2N5_9CUCU|nr:hypothetical protein NQ317_012482 [Molorchus minor]